MGLILNKTFFLSTTGIYGKGHEFLKYLLSLKFQHNGL